MKHQYFGDRHDFYKYDLLLHLMSANAGLGFAQLVFGVMLTPDDGSTDGGFTAYAAGRRDARLCSWLQEHVAHGTRDIRLLADFPAIATAAWTYTPVLDEVPVGDSRRRDFFAYIATAVTPSTLLFLDPDIGFVVSSTTSSTRPKYVDWPEVVRLYDLVDERSLMLVYQHAQRMKREVFYARLIESLRARCEITNASVIAPDGSVCYALIAKTPQRLREVETALAPYILANDFFWPRQNAR
jgi:hypothetical protein